MINFFKDLVRNEFGSTVYLYKESDLKGFLKHVFVICCVFLVIAVITWSISFSRQSKKKIDIEQIDHYEYRDRCVIKFRVENRNPDDLYIFTLDFDIKDKNTGKTICSERTLFYYSSSVGDYYEFIFISTQTDDNGIEYKTAYEDMQIEYKLVKAEFSENVYFYLLKYISIAVVGLPLVYYLGKFTVVVFPICLYAHSYNIKNFFLRMLVRIIFFLPYLWGGMFFAFGNPKDGGGLRGKEIAVDADGNIIGVYDPKTHEVRSGGRIVIPTHKSKTRKK